METNKVNVMGKEMQIPEGMTFGELAKEFQGDFPSAILLAKQGNVLKELDYEITDADDISFLDLRDEEGMRLYHRGVSFLLVKAARDIIGEDALVVIEHSLRGNLYCEIRKPAIEITEALLSQLENKMKEYVAADLPILKRTFRKDIAIYIAKKQGMKDKAELFRFRRASNINLYELDGFYDYFYGYMPLSTGALQLFGLMPYENGLLLRFPDPENPGELLPFQDSPKISSTFMEQMRWCQLMEVSNVADLNNSIVEGKFGDLIRINEALHEKKIAQIADQIYHKMDKVKVVLIAGPSSSGKTSFANRLCIQLRALGVKPHKVSLDDYFINREDTPLDENGKKNFERIEALDLKLLNDDLKKIIAGEKVELPFYNFVTGKREYNGDFVQLGEGEILVMEGIHGLNDRLTPEIPAENKFKIFISAITQLNIDDHNRISTSDSRLIRRMVRDFQFRGRSAAKTISSWNEVTQGEEDNIFPFQENADAVFNSATLYELSVLKQYAEPQLFAIDPSMPEYVTAKRLIKFLGYFLAAPGLEIPNNSLIKEFVGGSCFKV
ncbi:MAG: nucleoside kinase [Bacteroidales bacterium]|nr:nucleoside kinase [Anaerotignum sp.]MCI5679843.1 nucleoside kinase [Bacteroidales bacterium]MDY3927105.1 nucleoside kinase [Anaerotignum sp.]